MQSGGHPISEQHLFNDLHLYCRYAIGEVNGAHRAGSAITSTSASVYIYISFAITTYTTHTNLNTASTHTIAQTITSASTILKSEVRTTSATSTSIPTDLRAQHLQEEHRKIYMIDRIDIDPPQALQHQHWEDNYDATSYILQAVNIIKDFLGRKRLDWQHHQQAIQKRPSTPSTTARGIRP